VSSEVIQKEKEAKVIYNVKTERPFRHRQIIFPDSMFVGADAFDSVMSKTLLKPRQRYRLDRLLNEQKRIELDLNNRGLYYFNKRYLLFEADSTVGNSQVDLTLVKKEDVPGNASRVYRINRVSIVADYSLSADSTLYVPLHDTVHVDGYDFIQDKRNFKPNSIIEVIKFKRGDRYSKTSYERTLTQLLALGSLKFVNIKFDPVHADSSLLNSTIYLTPFPKKSLRLEFQAVSKSNNFVGPGLSITSTNRNLFGGSELFQLRLSSSYEVQVGQRTQNALNAFETSLEASLTFPRFMVPFRADFPRQRYLPKTKFNLGGNLQNRVSYFRLSSFNGGYGYIWRETSTKTHELLPAEITYVRTDQTSAEFRELLDQNPVLASSFDNQFILGGRYSFTFNTSLRDQALDQFRPKLRQRNSYYFSGGLDFSGNLASAIQRATEGSSEKPYEIFGVRYSRYVRGDVDFRYYWKISNKSTLATRLTVGAGYAFENADSIATLPYIKQFAVGGSTSVRAFPARSVGPGTYDIRTDPSFDDTYFIDQRADLKLEGSLEYRFKMIGSLDGALFVDAGNIWSRDDTRPGGKFEAGDFLEELAVGTGFGVRYDFKFFIFRIDTAFPIRKPVERRWVFDEIDFGSSGWRRDNLIFNIAIGYPF
jgi:outer membrane protein assembly factor BamA